MHNFCSDILFEIYAGILFNGVQPPCIQCALYGSAEEMKQAIPAPVSSIPYLERGTCHHPPSPISAIFCEK
jgi:hypothetical protein